jgi:hypothetical protein
MGWRPRLASANSPRPGLFLAQIAPQQVSEFSYRKFGIASLRIPALSPIALASLSSHALAYKSRANGRTS